jgi:hypothetical protein
MRPCHPCRSAWVWSDQAIRCSNGTKLRRHGTLLHQERWWIVGFGRLAGAKWMAVLDWLSVGTESVERLL